MCEMDAKSTFSFVFGGIFNVPHSKLDQIKVPMKFTISFLIPIVLHMHVLYEPERVCETVHICDLNVI